MRRAGLLVVLASLLAIAVPSARAQATVRYLPMRNAALVARTYQHYLNTNGFKQRCHAVNAYLVRCAGLTTTNDPDQQWHPWRTEIRKVAPRVAERRIWIDGKSLGRPGLDKLFYRDVKGF